MAYYLQMDGVDDHIKLPTMAFNEIVFDFTVEHTDGHYFQGSISASQLQRVAGSERFGAFWTTLYVNGIEKAWNSKDVVQGTRLILKYVSSANNPTFNTSTLMANGTGTLAFMKAKLYDVKFYNAGVLVAHYDMTLGNVLDQSGNGRHATLTGGTWVSDGPPSGTAYTASLSDSLTASDTVSKRLTIAVVDTVSTSETESERSAKTLGDAVTMTDALSRKLQRYITLNDNVGTAETLNASGGNSINISDSVIIADSIRKALTLAKTDAVMTAETESDAIQRQLADAFTQLDSIMVTGGKAALLTDSLAISDAHSKTLSRAVAEALGMTDSIERRANVSVRLYDVILTTETFSKLLPNAPTIIGTIALKGSRELNVYLAGSRVLDVKLRGDIK